MIEISKKSRKEREKELRENEIIDCAEALFLKKGFYFTTVDHIATCSELSKKTIYTFFQSKEEILIRVYIKAVNNTFPLYKQAVETPKTGLEKLLAFAKVSYHYYCENPDYIPLFDLALHAIKKSRKVSNKTKQMLYESANVGYEHVEKIFNLGVSDKTLRDDLDLHVAISYFMYQVQGIAKMYINSDKSYYESFLKAIEYFLDGLSIKPKA